VQWHTHAALVMVWYGSRRQKEECLGAFARHAEICMHPIHHGRQERKKEGKKEVCYTVHENEKQINSPIDFAPADPVSRLRTCPNALLLHSLVVLHLLAHSRARRQHLIHKSSQSPFHPRSLALITGMGSRSRRPFGNLPLFIRHGRPPYQRR